MTLQNKVNELKAGAVVAAHVARFWEEQIRVHGEEKATAFYTHIGLNHLGKSVEWEGLALSRKPTEFERLHVKAIAGAQDSSKDQIENVLLRARTRLIEDGLEGIADLNPASLHTLTLAVDEDLVSDLREQVVTVYGKGRRLVANELGRKQIAGNDDEDLDELVDLTAARIANDIQARLAAAAARFRLLGLTGHALERAISDELRSGSVSYIDRAATGLANRVLNMGRSAEAQSRSDEWERVEYSALLDQNVCAPCSAADGQSSVNENDLTPAPNPDCQGADWCRCFLVYVTI